MSNTSRGCCHCDHYALPQRALRSPQFSRRLAQQVATLELSGDATVDLILSELLDRHAGRLIGFDGKVIDFLDRYDPAALAIYDGLFGEDQRRTINRFKARADGVFRYRLQERLIHSVLMIHFAMAIRHCRTQGGCARHPDHLRSLASRADALTF